MAMDPRVKAGIFKGESGGDYNALFGFSNRPGGQFANTNLTGMTVDEAIAFANPSGPYAQWVKSQIGRVATPMGGYQIVGDTLKQAKNWAGLRGDEMMTPEIQDRLGEAILAKQGTGAWEGYKGPSNSLTAEDYAPRSLSGVGSPDVAASEGGSGEEYEPADTADAGGGQFKLPKSKPKKSGREKLGDAVKTLGGDLNKDLGMGQAPGIEVPAFMGGDVVPGVTRPPFQPQQAPMPGGGGDLRTLLAQLMGGQRGNV